MQGDRKAIAHLNKALFNALTAINQFFLHARMFGNWGLEELDERDYKESIRQMKQADRLIGRILFLEGLPNLQNLGKLLIGETPQECLECDQALVRQELADLREGIAYCESAGDYVSRDLLTSILHAGEEHLDWLETQADLIARLGLETYLQAQIGG
ncbi:MAG TPA: bacterioferritin [Chiayiivirga sp.]|jgi:bacterioferritin|uniref:Bacterioferritin n=1 Tax=Denitratimonas tolerans TaxID=1338420 RepID=A0AAW9R564_9GAMM|nr:bacterioferritin [Chiayiivirga sp.]HMN35301.1 bacterioferritin [Chiayiivirga sp.]HRN59389.1 bacterioferritin [Chiayiivirga sp.]HRO86944.1 bacterioferritin [Chiayiivirga sp.]HRQ34226.1 bacterioferritin [Chiayiivirga sp.]